MWIFGLPISFFLLNQVNCDDDAGNFDYFTLSMEWPRGFCTGMKAKGRDCDVSKDVPGWVLHGLWPSNKGKDEPNNCKPAPEFNIKDIESLEGEMKKYWPKLLDGGAIYSFWKHEYTKHGTCAASLDGFRTVEEYFRKALDLLHLSEPLDKLNSEGISPREEAYAAHEVKGALHRAYGAEVCVQCKENILTEIHVCHDKDLEKIDCPKCTVSCPDGKVFYRPLPGMSTKWSGGTFMFVLVLPGIVLYFVLGMLFNTFRGLQGPDIIPHRELIGDLPELIFDGIMFTVSVVSCNEDKEPRHEGFYGEDREAMVS